MSSNFGFGFTGGDDQDPQPGFDMNSLGEMLQQLGAMMQQSGGQATPGSGAVNWELVNDNARKALVAEGDPSLTDGQRSATETAVDLAEVWLDAATDFPATGGRPAAWCRSEWLSATLPAWQSIVDPIAAKVQGSVSGLMPGAGGQQPALPEGLPPEMAQMLGPLMGMAQQLGANLFAMQVAQGLAGLAGEVVSAADVGVPLTDDGRPALLPVNIREFGEGLGVNERDTMLFLALRECAHQRLFAHVPWLRARMTAAVEEYAGGIAVDSSRIESALSGIDPSNPEAMQEVLSSGVVAGFPIVDVKVQLIDGKYHDVDSSALAFEIATRACFREALQKGKSVLLEPIMKVEVVTPEDYYGDVIGDLKRRRGQIQGMEDSVSGKVVTAEVPLAEMFGYATSVRSMSQGRATYTMEFKHYSEAPRNVAEAIVAARSK